MPHDATPRIEHGEPDDFELAALIAVLAHLTAHLARPDPGAAPLPAAWAAPPARPVPWRLSILPR